MAFRFEFDPIHRMMRIKFSESVTEEDLAYFYRMAALLVESLDPLSAVIETYKGSYGASFLLPPEVTHGVWIEMFQVEH